MSWSSVSAKQTIFLVSLAAVKVWKPLCCFGKTCDSENGIDRPVGVHEPLHDRACFFRPFPPATCGPTNTIYSRVSRSTFYVDTYFYPTTDAFGYYFGTLFTQLYSSSSINMIGKISTCVPCTHIVFLQESARNPIVRKSFDSGVDEQSKF